MVEQVRWWTSPKWRAFTAIAISFITLVVSGAFSFLALSAIADDFDVTLRVVGWVVIIEALIIAALLLPMGGMADVVGDKRFLSAGVVIFGVGTLFTGLAPTFALLIVARVVMAIGNALIQSVGTGMLVGAFPEDERGIALGAQTTAVAVGSATAPLLGGLGLELLSWQTVFLLLLIPTAVSFVAVRTLIESDERGADHRQHLDLPGGMLSALTIAVLILTITNPLELNFVSPVILGGVVVTAVLAIAFIRWELHTDEPMIDLRLFAISVFRIAVIVRILAFMTAITTSLLLPVYLLSFREADGVTTGVILAALAVGIGLSAQLSGRMYDRIGPRVPSLLGLGLQVAMSLVFAFATGSTPLLMIGVVAAVSGLAIGMWNVPGNSAMMTATPPQLFGVVGAFTNVTRTLGNVFGQAIAALVVASVMASRGFDIPLGELPGNLGAGAAFNDGWRVAYLVAAGLSAAGFLVALLLPGKAAAKEAAPATA